MAMLFAVWLLGAALGCGQVSIVGLRPESPPVSRQGFTLFTEYVELDTLTPTFRWQPLSACHASDLPGGQSDPFEQVTYELRIWRTTPGVGGKLVYARAQLTTTEHRLAHALAPGTRYLWSVRAHFFLHGQQRVTEWALAGYPLRSETVPSDACLRFRTP